ncbi:MAG: excinuclease ABC subunit UvrA [Alphaproteobacteria bacterium]|nr:excinuclease ABC subunit UvrA [Alphaproteobacteria bacterium]
MAKAPKTATKNTTPKATDLNTHICVRGAKEHNLKNVDVDIPRNELVVITGLSGSGKSSLAFDTIYAEGQRRYVESLSAYARQFLNIQDKPDVESITGLSPAIAIDQKTTSRNPRSTVGTVTEIYDYLRLLYARIGVPYSPATGLPIESQTVSQMVDRILELPEGAKVLMLSPIIRGQKGTHVREMLDLKKRGFQRVKVNGEMMEIDDVPSLDKNKKHNIEVVVDRLVIRGDLGNRLPDSLETALDLSDGLVLVEVLGDKPETITLSSKFACPVSGFTLTEIEPRLFSFNSPFGACPVCDGLGSQMVVDADLIVPDTKLTLKDGAIAPWANSTSKYYIQTLEGLAKHFGFRLDVPFKDLKEDVKEMLLYGSGDEVVKIPYQDGFRNFVSKKPFEGIIPNMNRRYLETDSDWSRDEIGKFQNNQPCEACNGHRLKSEALCVKVGDHNIGQVTEYTIEKAAEWFELLDAKLSEKHKKIAEKILLEIRMRLGFLVNVGLDYLTLSRESGTLSGGESQRIRLASQIGAGLTGVLYVLDEPSIGLHQCDNERLLATLRNLRNIGNTVIVVEHDEDTMRAADFLIDMGPGAGVNGGNIVAAGTPEEVMANEKSVTGQYLKEKLFIPVPAERRAAKKNRKITIHNARTNNLKGVTVDIPIGIMTVVSGVSGGGKSSLVIETLYKAVMKKLHNSRDNPGAHDKITGLENIDKIIEIDQSPIGRTPRSNPATYTGAFGPIRDWFAGLPESQARGYKPGRFSFNVKGGRCETCEGDGMIKIEMHFLPDVYVKCDACKGKRYNRETLEIKYKDKSISDVLSMTVAEAVEFFDRVPVIREKLAALQEVGLGYIQTGQSATTLSGGEAQRIKLAKELSKRATGSTLYILDEPTTGLHTHDIGKLLQVLQKLVDSGNSMVIIEHNLDVIKSADWVIDIGPGGGSKGGYVVAEGTPEQVAKIPESVTGKYIKPLLEKKKKKAA